MNRLKELIGYYSRLLSSYEMTDLTKSYDEDSITLIRDEINGLTDDVPEEVKELDIRFVSNPEILAYIVKGIPRYNQWGDNLTFPDAWWANLDRIYNGTYPFDEIPDYLKPVTKQYYGE